MQNLYHGDCIEVMATMGAESVDMVLSDVPYGQTQNEWDKPIPFDLMWAGIRRVAKPSAAIVLMAAQPFAAKLICSNLDEFRYDLIWSKNKPTGFLNAKKQPLRSHEHILVFYRKPSFFNPQKTQGHEPLHRATQTSHGKNYGRKTQAIESGGNTDRYPLSVLPMPIVNNDSPEKVHPTQKPVDLMAWLIRSYTRPREIVLDIAAGSGTTALAAAREGRSYCCIESDAAVFATMRARVAAASITPLQAAE